jgi:hypothetical protein
MIEDLLHQYRGVHFSPDDIVFVSMGGNDFLSGLHQDRDGEETSDFLRQYGFILSQITSKKIIANVYDPFFGSAEINNIFPKSTDQGLVRRNYDSLNRGIEALAHRFGILLDLRKHFLTGDSSWFDKTIEPSLRGASEIRRTIWVLLDKLGVLEEKRKT